MVTTEITCCRPFVNVILRCDVCNEITTGDGFQVVKLADGRTICKTCLQDIARDEWAS